MFKGYLTRKRLDEIYQHYANMEDSEEEEDHYGYQEESEVRDSSQAKAEVKQGKAEFTLPIVAATSYQNPGLKNNSNHT